MGPVNPSASLDVFPDGFRLPERADKAWCLMQENLATPLIDPGGVSGGVGSIPGRDFKIGISLVSGIMDFVLSLLGPVSG
ncbi:hypothetical protein ElyMa_003916900 [Elysia marginata]|uniref:Uncharacterized protein n=1 Tax=Elysia marginata TaxID=1093978 RepID=A0AAV4FR05_9GAST|nr:hypothetical protein ElyMa_003916900 [Elysia marginata]